MTILYVDIMWALLFFGVTLWTTCCVVMNPGLRGVRRMGLVLSYGLLVWMAAVVPWRETAATWCLFAASGGLLAGAYELWARLRYRGTARAPRPLVLLHGLVLWPMLIPDVVEGMLVDAGVLPAAVAHDEPAVLGR